MFFCLPQQNLNLNADVALQLGKYPNFVLRDALKRPYSPAGGLASCNDPTTWGDFKTCSDKVIKGKWAGIGFQLSNSPFTVIDLDHCVKEDDNLTETAERLTEAFSDTYIEYSPSGNGLHIWCIGEVPTAVKTSEVEIYSVGRYITLTWQAFNSSPITDCQDKLSVLYKSLKPAQNSNNTKSITAHHTQQHKNNAELSAQAIDIMCKIRSSRQDFLFASLFDEGDLSRYDNDHSRADLALLQMLAFWTGNDPQLMDFIFTQSALCRDKWLKRADYRNRSINQAIRANTAVYTEEYTTTQEGTQTMEKVNYNEVIKSLGLTANHENISQLIGVIENNIMKLNDDTLAKAMYRLLTDKLVYVSDVGKWLEYDGVKWVNCVDVRDYIAKLVPAVYSIMIEYYDTVEPSGTKAEIKAEEARRKAILTKLLQYGSARLYRGLIYMMEIFAGIRSSVLDSHKNDLVLNAPSCTILLQDNGCSVKDHDLRDYITKAINADIDDNAGHLWADFVEQVMPSQEIRHFMQMYCGYMLTGYTYEQMLMILYGEGGTGKSVFCETIHYMLGDYATTIPIEALLAARNDGGATATPEIAKLKGKRLAVTSEAGANRTFRTDLIKVLTGGETITARFLHGNPFEFDPAHKIIMSTNHLPNIPISVDTGIRRRMCIVPFDNVIPADDRDVYLLEKLKTPKEIAGVLNWCLAGYSEYKTQNKPLMAILPKKVQELTQSLLNDSDTLGQFLKEECVEGSDCKVGVSEFIAAYERFCGTKVKRNTVSRELEERGFKKKRTKYGMCFLGIKLMDFQDTDFVNLD